VIAGAVNTPLESTAPTLVPPPGATDHVTPDPRLVLNCTVPPELTNAGCGEIAIDEGGSLFEEDPQPATRKNNTNKQTRGRNLREAMDFRFTNKEDLEELGIPHKEFLTQTLALV
jgi:hypothetical protein